VSALGLVGLTWPSPARAQSDLGDVFRTLLVAQYAAIAHGDTAALRRGLADDLRWVIATTGTEVTKGQFLAAVAQLQEPAPRFDVDSVHVQQMFVGRYQIGPGYVDDVHLER
jgi:hypothetical protein